MPRGHRTATETSCKISDLLNQISQFVDSNPLWYEDGESIQKMGMAYHILSQISNREEVSQEEEDFIMGIFATIKEITGQ